MTMMQQPAARAVEQKALYERDGRFNNASLWKRVDGPGTARPKTHSRNFQRYLKSFGLITMVGVSASLALPMGKAQARGNFSATCSNLKLNAVDFSKTATLTADCKREDQRDPKKVTHQGASINLNEVLTVNQGRLQWARRPGGGDFQQSCSRDGLGDIGIPIGLGGTSVLVAFCNHHLQRIDLNENIVNDDGNLKYVGWEKVIFGTGSPKPTPPTVQPPLKPGPK